MMREISNCENRLTLNNMNEKTKKIVLEELVFFNMLNSFLSESN